MDNMKMFLKYWKKRNFKKMYRYCQKTWRANHTQGELAKLFNKLVLEDFEIVGELKVTLVTTDVELSIKVNGEFRNIQGRVLCERQPYKPSEDGVWGVNPISVIKHYM